jgi:hypothetical protein
MMDDIKPGGGRPSPDFTPDEQTQTEAENEAVMQRPAFLTPAQTAERDQRRDELPEPVDPGTDLKHTSDGKGMKKFFNKLKNLSTRQKIILYSVIAGLLIASVGAWWFFLRENPAPAPAPAAKQEPAPEPPKPAPLVSGLTGMPVTEEQSKLPVTGVMIENSPDARPQSALYDAGVVYEAIAEGGITRFLALFQEAKPGYIGPVRSVRPYYLDFLVPYDAPITHAGGSGQALAEIKAQGIKDIDHGANAGAFQRVGSRFAPHNLYTSREALLTVHGQRGYYTSTFTGFKRKEEPPKPVPTSKTIDLNISSYLYNPTFAYDPGTNSYLRSQAGRPHIDEKAGKQINPKVVVILVMSHSYAGIYSVYGTTPGGKAYFAQDGVVTEGTWEKADRKTQFTFKDANGQVQGLNPGQTWVSIVSDPSAVIVKP